MDSVPPLNVFVLVAGVPLEAARARAGAICAFCPVRERIAMSIESLNQAWAAPALRKAIDANNVVILITRAEHARPARDRLADFAGDAGVPLLVITDAPASLGSGADGPVVELAFSADDRHVASVLLGLLASSRATRELSLRCRALERATQAASTMLERTHDEMESAALLQRELLNHDLPKIDGLSIGSISRASSSLNGDMFDVVRLGPDHLGLLVADAAGHGVSAAITLMLLSKLMPMTESHAPGARVLSPGEALSRFNDAFIDRRGPTHLLVTAAYCVLDIRTWELESAVAGHPAPIVYSSVGRVELDAGGPPLGAISDVTYPSLKVGLEQGDSLAIYSDGFERAFEGACTDPNAASLPAHERHLWHFARMATRARQEGASLREAIADLERSLDQQGGSLHQPDDITLLAIRREAAQQTATLRIAA
ncbi:MAG: SpoIIE family protein phosphatase [Phycisphaerales bacterium]|nr:SpoIIE family protein phosphatase [Phycisphaerales bacterium]